MTMKSKFSGAALKKKLGAAGLQLADMFLHAASDFTSRAPNHPDLKIRSELRNHLRKIAAELK
jgi:hypothetical protein